MNDETHLSTLLQQLMGVAIASLLVSTTCFAESGQVIDEATKKPIAGAFVFARWSARVANPVIGGSRCYHFAITQSDKDGRFTLPENSGNVEPWLIERHRIVSAYAPGYEELPVRKANSPEITMRRYAGPVLARLEQLGNLSAGDCVSDEEEKKLLPFYRTMYEEAKAIAKERKELAQVAGFRALIARVTLGEKEFNRRISSGEYFK